MLISSFLKIANSHKLSHGQFNDFLYSHPDITNIGYTWKSKTRERRVNQIEYIYRMVGILKEKGHARKIFVSPYSNVTTKLTDRDLDYTTKYLDEINGIKGNTQGRFYRYYMTF